MIGSDLIRKSSVKNPFSYSQARNYRDSSIASDFQPTSVFWSLFTEQHEILIGTRGSGKTILLKMMRYSYLRLLDLPEASSLVKEKKYICIYTPTNMEFMGCFEDKEIPEHLRTKYFELSFNLFIAVGFIQEIRALIQDLFLDEIEQVLKNREVTKKLSQMWFPDNNISVVFLDDLIFRLESLYENLDTHSAASLESAPPSFQKGISNPIKLVGKHVAFVLKLSNEPIWILCIDEAEFLKERYQKSFNTIMRSDSGNVVFKLATLPFYWSTLETQIDGTNCDSNGNDFNFRPIDMDFNSKDFKDVADGICYKRMKKAFPTSYNFKTLGEFLGKFGKDNLIDYYNLEFGKSETKDSIESRMNLEFGSKRKNTISDFVSKEEGKKPIYDRFAPLFYLREMYKKSRSGNTKVGWYAGEDMVRKLSQGNPRRYIQLMHALFEQARNRQLSPQTQHEVLFNQSCILTNSAFGIPLHGPELLQIIRNAATCLQQRTHGETLIETGNSFSLTKEEFQNQMLIQAIKIGVAYSYIITDRKDIKEGISESSRFSLANIVCAKYWIPMRFSGQPGISLLEGVSNISANQLNLFFHDGKNNGQ